MGDYGPESLARGSKEASPSLTIHDPEIHVSPLISPDVERYTHTTLLDEQNGILNQPSHYPRDQADKARAYLRDLWSDGPGSSTKPVEFIIPYLSWSALREDPEFTLHKLKTSFDSLKSIFTVFPMESMRHCHILGWVNQLATFAKQNFDTSISRRFKTIPNIGVRDFKGKWEGSFRKADFVIAWRKDGGGIDIHTIVEVGVSQSQNQFREVMEMYFEGLPQISRVILIDIIEAPQYVQPKNFDIDELKNLNSTEFQVASNQGPVWYKGIQWVGHNTISWEVWERDPKMGDPVQIFKTTIIPKDSGFQLPFFEIPTWIADKIEAVTVKPADIEHLWSDDLRDAVIEEAKWRMGGYVSERSKQADETANIARQEEEAEKKEAEG
ncbi:hypothetical protein GJ744_011795 [Endocarpon pusillum]|uniref:Uncharacterized protein n=1 Tax=Endocarpon pusillum TaxID=364733 RepID=A0A8H7E4K3_9EURO|nr:hypothetical protein GJ744_011795 [Endocarpon pusillum]